MCTTEGRVVMQGSERRRLAARYKADRALFLLLLGAPTGGWTTDSLRTTKYTDPSPWSTRLALDVGVFRTNKLAARKRDEHGRLLAIAAILVAELLNQIALF